MNIQGTGQHRGLSAQFPNQISQYGTDMFGQPDANTVITMPPGTSYTETSRDSHTIVDITMNTNRMPAPNMQNLGYMPRPVYMVPPYQMYPTMYSQVPVVTSMPQPTTVYPMQHPQPQIPQQQQKPRQPPQFPFQKKVLQFVDPSTGNNVLGDNSDLTKPAPAESPKCESNSSAPASVPETISSSTDEIRHKFTQGIAAAFQQKIKISYTQKQEKKLEPENLTSFVGTIFNKNDSETTHVITSRKEDNKALLAEYEQTSVGFTQRNTNISNISKLIHTQDSSELLRQSTKEFKTIFYSLFEEKLKEPMIVHSTMLSTIHLLNNNEFGSKVREENKNEDIAEDENADDNECQIALRKGYHNRNLSNSMNQGNIISEIYVYIKTDIACIKYWKNGSLVKVIDSDGFSDIPFSIAFTKTPVIGFSSIKEENKKYLIPLTPTQFVSLLDDSYIEEGLKKLENNSRILLDNGKLQIILFTAEGVKKTTLSTIFAIFIKRMTNFIQNESTQSLKKVNLYISREGETNRIIKSKVIEEAAKLLDLELVLC